MKIIQTCHLTEAQIGEIEVLTDTGDSKDRPSYIFPLEEGASFYLLYDPKLICALTLIPQQQIDTGGYGTAECAAFTCPNARKKGYFTALFQAAEPEYEDWDLMFLADRTSIGAIETLKALGAEFERCDYRMEAVLDQLLPAVAIIKDSTVKRPKLILRADHQAERNTAGSEDITLSFYLDSRLAGSCRAFLPMSLSSSASLYSLEILPDLRGRGLGTEAFSLVLAYLKEAGIRRLSLHVSGDNPAALKLYQKTGFQITETLSRYLY